jgi:hypothetical protein
MRKVIYHPDWNLRIRFCIYKRVADLCESARFSTMCHEQIASNVVIDDHEVRRAIAKCRVNRLLHREGIDIRAVRIISKPVVREPLTVRKKADVKKIVCPS